MRILVVGPTQPDTFADNVAFTFTQMGHDVELAGPARSQRGPRKARNALDVLANHASVLDERLQAGLVKHAAAFRPHLTVTLDARLRPATVRGLAATGTITALWFPDHVSNLGRHELFLAGYDRLYFKNPRLVEQLTQVHGLPVRYLPEAANPAWHHPVGEYGTDPVIVLAGNIHPTRAVLLERLMDAGVPLRLYGSAIPSWIAAPQLRNVHTGRSIHREEKAQVFRAARAVLNNLHPAEFAGSNCRLFEATASGAVVLTEKRPGMGELFTAGQDLLEFDSFDTLVDQCRHLLASPEHGAAMADAAAQRALADHTYDHRLRFMLEDLGLA